MPFIYLYLIMKLLEEFPKYAKYVFYLLLIAVGFFAGRKTIKQPAPVEVIKYIKGETITEVKEKPVPYLVTRPADTLDIIKKCIEDGIYKELFPKETVYIDTTAAIVKDWATIREYNEKIFDSDTVGLLKVNAKVQYNRLSSLGYEFKPIVKNVDHTVYTVKKVSPFVGTGMIINPNKETFDALYEVNGGLFFNDKYGFQLKYQRGLRSDNNYFGGSVLFKF